MTEPRARAARHKGQLNFETELKSLLFAYGDVPNPLPETVRVLDEIVTDFIIETCHQAARSASYSNRQKIKVDDFKFAVRRNEAMLGRATEMLAMNKEITEMKKVMDLAEGKIGLEKGGAKGVGRGKGRRKKEKVGKGVRGRGRDGGRGEGVGGDGDGEEDEDAMEE